MLQYFETLTDDSGNSLLGATVKVTNFPSGTNATIYSANGTASPIATSTVAADITGQVSFYIPDGAYILTYSYQGTQYKVKSPVQMIDPLAFTAQTSTGGANVYVVSSVSLPAQLYAGLKVEFKASATNTAASTLNLNSTGAQPINQPGGIVLSAGMIQLNGLIRVEWDGAQWQLLGSQSQPFYGQTAAEIAAGVTPVNFVYAPGNILRYGGDPTGVANSDVAGQAMLDQRGQGGAVCYVPTGTYKQAVVWKYPLSLTPLHLHGDGMFASVVTTALDIESLTNLGADGTHGLPDPYVHDISFFNTFPVVAGAGATHFHVHLQNPLNARIQRVYCKSAFGDTDFNANNHAGVWLERVGGYGAAFQNLISECWIQNGQINMGTSDSAVTLCICWGHPCDYAIKVDSTNIAVHDNYDLTGSRNHGAVWLTANATLCRVTNNFFDGDQGAVNSGYGVWADLQSSNFIEDNTFWTMTKAAIWLVNPTVWTVSGNVFLNCGTEDVNTDDSDIVLQATAFASNNIVTNNQHFRTDARANAAYAVFEKNSGASPQANRIAFNSIVDTAGQYQAAGILLAATLFNGGSVAIGNVGKNAATEVYSAPANALTLTGCTTSPTVTPRITRQGNLIEIYVPAVSANSNSTSCKLTGVPAAFRPANTARGSCIVTSSGNAVNGFWAFDSSGDITLYVVVPATGVVNSAGFVNDGLAKGIIDGLTITYPLI